jgi:hypothetical protein
LLTAVALTVIAKHKMLNVVMQNAIMRIGTECHNKAQNPECHYSKSRYAECRGAILCCKKYKKIQKIASLIPVPSLFSKPAS